MELLPSRPNPTQAEALNGLRRILLARPEQRIVIAGGPRAGKTHLAERLAELKGIRLRGSDELRHLEWSESSLEASRWFDEPGPWVLEGVVMPRALRKWLARTDEGAPADVIVWLPSPVVDRTRGQHAMAAGCQTVWNEILPELRRRRVPTIEFS